MYLIGGKCTVYRLQKPPALLVFCLNPIRIRVPKEKVIPTGMAFSFSMVSETGLEPIEMEVSGGHFLPPVQTLVATLIFAHRAKMQIESTIPKKQQTKAQS